MEKDFDKWNIRKKKVHARDERVLFHEREIWWCALGANVGYEQDGKNHDFERPVICTEIKSGHMCDIAADDKKEIRKISSSNKS